MDDSQLRETYLSGETIFDGHVVHLEKWSVLLPNGEKAAREVVKHVGAAAIVPVDGEGMTVAGLRAALDEGVRALVCTPRAQNPTGASLSAARARALREVLAEHPYVLVIEDDHFSLLSSQPFRLAYDRARRWIEGAIGAFLTYVAFRLATDRS